MIFIENKLKREFIDFLFLNFINLLDDFVMLIGKFILLINKFFFMNENEVLIINDVNRLMWMVV